MFYKSDLGMWKILMSVKAGLDKEYDYVLIVTGDTGSGKSKWALHLMEAWQKVIGKEVTEDLILQNNVDKKKWLTAFKDLKELDINVFDEGAKGLSSKQWNEKFSKLLEQLFQVIRFKRFFTVIIVPNFFRLDKFFREDRLRGLIYVDRRGHYKFLSKKRVVALSTKNDKFHVKNMNLVNPIHSNTFPDYKGVMLKQYDKMKSEGVENILQETITEIDLQEHIPLMVKAKNEVIKLASESRLSQQEIANKVVKQFPSLDNLDQSTISKWINPNRKII